MFLSADIGGTKTLMRLENHQGQCIKEQSFPSQQYPDIESIITNFLESSEKPIAACLAVAGPVLHHNGEQTSQVTNLPWQISSQELKQNMQMQQVCLINDFVAVAHGIDVLQANDLMTLQQGEPKTGSNKAIIGAGTGLGQAFISYNNDNKQIHATEGGHVDFAPMNEQQWQLRKYISQQTEHVSYELLLSGKGLVTIFSFLCLSENQQTTLDQVLANEDPAAEISRLAHYEKHAQAISAMHIFMQIYGAQAGNLALNTLCFNGVYIAGGIAAKNLYAFEDQTFMQSFLDKGKMRDLMPSFPVFVIKNPQTGLLGAGAVARNMV